MRTRMMVLFLAIAMAFVLALAGTAGAGPYVSEVADSNPIAWWRLNETSTASPADNIGSIGSDVDGTYNSGTSVNQEGLVPSETVNTSAGFDGISGWISIPDHAEINTDNDVADLSWAKKTVELWFRASGLTGRQCLYEQGGGGRGLNVYLDGSDLYLGAWNDFTIGGSEYWTAYLKHTGIQIGQDYHVVLVMNGNAGKTGDLLGYLNGDSAGFVSAGGSPSNVGILYEHAGDISVGVSDDKTLYHDNNGSDVDDGSDHYFYGLIDEVALYNVALSSDDVIAHYQASQLPVPEPASIGLIGLAALGLRKRRRRRA
jgi:hypothetical protein